MPSTEFDNDCVIGENLPQTLDIMERRFQIARKAQREAAIEIIHGGKPCEDPEIRDTLLKCCVCFLLDGKKDHHIISGMLGKPESVVREVLQALKDDSFISTEVKRRIQVMEEELFDVATLGESYLEIKQNRIRIVKKFFEVFFQKGREQYLTHEIEDLFDGVDMKAQSEKFWKQMAYTIEGVLNGKSVATELKKLGVAHRGYHTDITYFKEKYYDLAGESLIETLQWFYQERWTDKLETTWKKTFSTVATVMKSV